MTETPVEQMSFEQAMRELEGVVDQLERGRRGAGCLHRALRTRRSAEETLRG